MAEQPSGPSPSVSSPSPGPNDQGANPASMENAISAEDLKQAYKAFKKRWKLTRLDHESRIGRSPLTSGSHGSSIVGIKPPDQFPLAIWEELAKQGRIKYAGNGQYAMP